MDMVGVSVKQVNFKPCPMRCEPEGDAYFHPKMSLRADFSR
jgi:hypothetical protein